MKLVLSMFGSILVWAFEFILLMALLPMFMVLDWVERSFGKEPRLIFTGFIIGAFASCAWVDFVVTSLGKAIR